MTAASVVVEYGKVAKHELAHTVFLHEKTC